MSREGAFSARKRLELHRPVPCAIARFVRNCPQSGRISRSVMLRNHAGADRMRIRAGCVPPHAWAVPSPPHAQKVLSFALADRAAEQGPVMSRQIVVTARKHTESGRICCALPAEALTRCNLRNLNDCLGFPPRPSCFRHDPGQRRAAGEVSPERPQFGRLRKGRS